MLPLVQSKFNRFRRLEILCGFSFTALVVTGSANGQAASSNTLSPEVHADRSVTFRVSAPKATDVTVTCDWTSNAQKLTKGENGSWSATLGPLPPSTYIYSFNVDGVPTTDPVNPRIKLRARGSASLVEIPSEKPGVQEIRDVPHGLVEVNSQKSSVLHGETRSIVVYTPPGYAKESTLKYPVLFLLHGSNDTPFGWTSVGNLNYVADNLIAENKMVPMVIVMPNGHATPFGQRGGGNNTTLFEKYLLEDVVPLVDSNYRIASGRENRALAGMSMGAEQSLYLYFHHFDKFSSIGAFCPSGYGSLESAHADLLADVKGTNEKIGVLWVGCGRQDTQHFGGSQKVAQVLESHKINHIWRPVEGVHNYALWRDELVEFLPLLFQARK